MIRVTSYRGSVSPRFRRSSLGGTVSIADKPHKPLGFLIVPFIGSKGRWATVDKEDFEAMSTFQLWVYLLWIGVAVHCDHRNLAYIIGAHGAPSSNAQRLQGWTVFLGQFPYTVVHVPGDDNSWGHLQSRWVTRPGGPVCAHASVKYTEMRSMGATSFRRRRLCAACRWPLQRADPHSTRDWGGFAGFRRAVPGRAPWPPHDLGAGRGRLSEEATPGVRPRGEGRKPRGRCNDGSA